MEGLYESHLDNYSSSEDENYSIDKANRILTEIKEVSEEEVDNSGEANQI
jgi:hypothetical protein